MQMVVYCHVFCLHFVGNVIYISLLLLSPLSSADLFNFYNQIAKKLYVVLSWFTIHNPFVVLFWFTQSVCYFILVYTIFMWFCLGLHNLYVVLSWFTHLCVVLSWFT
jgi:hypothetical protein